jgi:hypothetical protein
MNVRFYIDPETEAPHIYEHGVDEEEVMDVLLSPGEGSSRSGRVAGGNWQDTSGSLSACYLCSRPGTGEHICDYRV